MPAYVIAAVSVTNPDAYAQYAKLAPAAIEQHGGRYLARGGKLEILEGAWRHARTVIVEFASVAQAQALPPLGRVPGRAAKTPRRRRLQHGRRGRRGLGQPGLRADRAALACSAAAARTPP